MATKPEIERLTVVEEQQKEMKKAIERMDARVESIDAKLDTLTSKFDSLTGGKQALMWLTGIIIAAAAVIVAIINSLKEGH